MTCRLPSLFLCVFLSLSLAGCGLGAGGDAPSAASQPQAVAATGMVHGGQSPITGAAIQLWAVGTTGYATGATALISATVTTSDGSSTMDSNANVGNANNTLPAGEFTLNFTSAYSCAGNPLVYLVATGGNPGLTAGTNNSAIVLMAPLGPCTNLNSSTFVSINEVTTVAATWALAQFMTYTGVIGAPSSNAASLASAFNEVNNLVNISTGAALATDTAGDTVPQSEINTFANTVVPCINSTGPTSTACSTLFTDIYSGLSPLTVLSGLLDLALFPNTNMSNLFGLATANTAFQPSLSAAPHNWTLTLGGAGSFCGYSGSGYTVNGTVSYGGSKTGRIYLALVNTSGGCGGGTVGTSIAAAGSYSISGVPPGTYTVYAFMDTLGYGAQNAADPTASRSSVTVSSSNLGGQNLTLGDPGTVTLTSAPSFNSLSGFNTGAVAVYSAIKNNGVEQASSYTLQWSTSSSFSTIAGSQTFPAVGTNGATVWFVNGLTDGSVYYFRAYGTSGGTPVGPYSTVSSAITIGAPSTGFAVSGSVTFPGSATGPMYVGFYNEDTSSVYVQYIANPVSAQAYTVTVPNNPAAVYIPVAVIDEDNNGTINAGDYQNTNNTNGAGIAVTAPTSNVSQTLPSGNSLPTVTTQHYSTGDYSFNLQVNTGTKLPVAVTLYSSNNSDGANVTGPMNVALCGQGGSSCGTGFQVSFDLGSTAPTVGDTYYVTVNYSDGTTDHLNAAVTAVLSNFATGLSPTTGTSTMPTFTWNAPICSLCSTYVYQFYLSAMNQGNIWSVPNNGNGLPYAMTSLTWGVDPSDPSNTPSVSSLSPGTTYSWAVTVEDSYGNQAIETVSYDP